MDKAENIIVLGGGASGLSFGVITTKNSIIIESEARLGGHSRTTIQDGWTFDRGPHIIFSKNQLALECIVQSLGRNVIKCKRNNKISFENKLLSYPIENGLNDLSFETRYKVFMSYIWWKIKKSFNPKFDDLEKWFILNFGQRLVEMYFKPYNEKVWKTEFSKLADDWVERIPSPKVFDIFWGTILKKGTDGYLHQLYYHYPLLGGYESIMNSWAKLYSIKNSEKSEIRLNEKVIEIDLTGYFPTVRTDKKIYKNVPAVYTLPIKKIKSICTGVPKHILTLIEKLQVNPMIVVSLGFEGDYPEEFTAIYFPDPDFLVNRISFPHVFSSKNVPTNSFMIQAEITVGEGEDFKADDLSIIQHVIEGLKQKRILGENKLIFSKVDHYEEAYVVTKKGDVKRLNEIKKYFSNRNLYLHGRFGSHDYLNVDGCLIKSIELHNQIDSNIRNPDEILKAFRVD